MNPKSNGVIYGDGFFSFQVPLGTHRTDGPELIDLIGNEVYSLCQSCHHFPHIDNSIKITSEGHVLVGRKNKARWERIG